MTRVGIIITDEGGVVLESFWIDHPEQRADPEEAANRAAAQIKDDLEHRYEVEED